MDAREQLGPADLRAAMTGYRDALRAHQDLLNKLNVYPVPDGDTGTNMALTIESVCEELDGADEDMAGTCGAISHGSLMGARGNSGVILSQVLRGFVDVLGRNESFDSGAVAEALSASATSAYEAVMRPVEGTILTVVRESAEQSAATAAEGGSMVDVLEAAQTEGQASLQRTPDLLPALAEAGVVDAGATGYLLLLDVLLHVVDGRALPDPPEEIQGPLDSVGSSAYGSVDDRDHPGVEHHDVSDLRYEVMYFLEAPDETVPAFKDVWAGIGDSIVVVGGDGIWNCHIHTDDIGAAIEAAVEVGRPRKIRVTDLLEQVEEEKWVRDADVEADLLGHLEPVTTAVVGVASGVGIQRIFHSLGVQGIVAGGQSMNPSTAQLVEMVEKMPADEIVILPNNKNIIAVADKVGEATDKHVRVVPTTSMTEAFAALLEYDPEASADDNSAKMAESAAAVISGEVCQAVRESSCEVGPILEGDYMGIGPDGIMAVNADIGEVAIRLLDRIVSPGHEVVTLIEGDGASDALTRHITLWLQEHRNGTAVEVHHGGQPLYPYLFGVE